MFVHVTLVFGHRYTGMGRRARDAQESFCERSKARESDTVFLPPGKRISYMWFFRIGDIARVEHRAHDYILIITQFLVYFCNFVDLWLFDDSGSKDAHHAFYRSSARIGVQSASDSVSSDDNVRCFAHW